LTEAFEAIDVMWCKPCISLIIASPFNLLTQCKVGQISIVPNRKIVMK
jgi:hypothetical protein